jgi:hypothetical protein
MQVKSHFAISLSAALMLSLAFIGLPGVMAEEAAKGEWCKVDDDRQNDPQWKDGMHGVMDMAFLNGSDSIIISEWPTEPLESPTISVWEMGEGRIIERGNVALPFPGGINYSGSTQCGVSIAIFEDNGVYKLVVGRCLDPNTQVVELYDLNDSYLPIVDSRVELLKISNPGSLAMHHLGTIGFDHQNTLWIFNGFNNQKDLDMGAQSTSTLHGSIIRGVISGNNTLEPHPDNIGYSNDSTWHPLVHSVGMRMPWKAAIDENGNWWVGDVGGSDNERIFKISEVGGNLGYVAPGLDRCSNCSGAIQPWISYTHDYNDTFTLEDPVPTNSLYAAVYVGLYVPDSDLYPEEISGKVIFGDFSRSWMRALDTQNRNDSSHFSHLGGVVDMELYEGEIFALRTGIQVMESNRDPGLWVYSSSNCFSESNSFFEAIDFAFSLMAILSVAGLLGLYIAFFNNVSNYKEKKSDASTHDLH